jgi:hypothetical protein
VKQDVEAVVERVFRERKIQLVLKLPQVSIRLPTSRR